MDWTNQLALPDGLITICPTSLCSMGIYVDAPGSFTWMTANRAVYVPFRISRTILVKNMFIFNGATISGNVDLGIYDKDGTRLVSTGSTAQAGASSVQTIAVVNTPIGPGLFYMALAINNTTATVYLWNLANYRSKCFGLAMQAAVFPLPVIATFATYSDYLYLYGLTARSFV